MSAIGLPSAKKRGFSSFGNATSNTSEKRTSNITPKSIKITNSKKSHKANMAKLKKEKKLLKFLIQNLSTIWRKFNRELQNEKGEDRYMMLHLQKL